MLFVWSFLASTIFPLGVEPFFVQQVVASGSWEVPVIVASLGNTLGSITILWMGYWGHGWIQKKMAKTPSEILQKAETWVNKFGYWLLLISWLPFLGDLLVFLISSMRPPIIRSILLLAIGKTGRFLFLAWISLAI